MPNLTQAIEVLTCEMSEEKRAYRELSRAEDRYQTNMGSEKILPRIAALEMAIQILKGHHQDTPTTDAQR